MDNQETEIDLKEIAICLVSNAVIIILASIVGALSMLFIGTHFIEKEFESSTKIYVLNKQDSQTVTYTDLQMGTQLTKDYAELVKSRTVTSQVIANLDLQNTYDDMQDIVPEKLAEMISVETTQQDTRILKITVTDTNPMRAQDIADAVRVAASNHIYEVMDIEAVNVVDYANLPERPVGPNLMTNSIIGAVFGFLLAAAIIVIRYLLDDTIKTPDEVERYLGLSVLASVPYDESLDTPGKKKSKKKKNGGLSKPGREVRIPTINLQEKKNAKY